MKMHWIILALATAVFANPTQTVIDGVDCRTPVNQVQGCYWSGTAPFCAGGCYPGWSEAKRDNCGDGECCLTGTKVLCCK
jgi:hypothetical protein